MSESASLGQPVCRPLARVLAYRFGRAFGLSRRAALWMARHPGEYRRLPLSRETGSNDA